MKPFLIDLNEYNIGQWGKSTYLLYWLIVVLIIVSLALLPFVYFDVSVRSTGIIRPLQERTEVRSVSSGIIDSVLYKEGQLIQRDSTLMVLRDNTTQSKLLLNEYDRNMHIAFIHDLMMLTGNTSLTGDIVTRLESPLYKQQISRFVFQKADQEASLQKVKMELHIDSVLAGSRVIAPKEMFDKIIEGEKLEASYKAFKNEQLSQWEQDLSKYKLELSQLENNRKLLEEGQRLLQIKAPVTGVIQGINTQYASGTVQAGETICTISPETNLVAECYVSTRDIGLLKLKQAAKIQVDAFDYKYFGMLSGKIISIDNDFTLVDNKPVFKVRCSFDGEQLHLINGYAAQIKKGLTLQARFIVTRRSVWQLLFDKIDDWVNPIAPLKNQ